MSKPPLNSDLKFILSPTSGIKALFIIVEMPKRGGNQWNQDEPKEIFASSLGNPKLCPIICKCLTGCQENFERELGDNLDTPCGGRLRCTIKNSIAARRIQESCDEKI